MKKLFITGGSGFVGGHLVSQANYKWKVTINYYQHPTEWSDIDSFNLDLNKQDKVTQFLDRLRPDVVLHQAALSNLDYCEQHPYKAHATNVEATALIAEWCQSASARLVFLSSDMVFDGEKGNYCESDPGGPEKIDRYRLGQMYCRVGGFDESLLRPITMSSGPPLLSRRPRDLSFNITKAKSVLSTKLLGIKEGLDVLFRK